MPEPPVQLDPIRENAADARVVAVAKDDQGAAWIGAATLDRYLHSVRQPSSVASGHARAYAARRSLST